MSFLRIAGVAKSFGATEVLHNIDLVAEQGEFLVLVGPSGCGKSTLLNMIAGLESISAGEISIKGRVVNEVHPSQRNIAMVFQSYALYPNMTVAQNITFGLEMHGIPKKERAKAMREVAQMLQIEHLLTRKPGQLSGGQRQRVAMGRALVRKPDVFLFDEPLSNLDAKLRVDMRTEIKRLHLDLGTTIVYVTHDQVEAMTLSSRIAVMNNGHILQIGPPNEIYDAPANVFVARFMGSPTMNLLDATVVASDDGLQAAIGPAGSEQVRLTLTSKNSPLKESLGRRVLLGIRPEAISDTDGRDSKAAKIQSISGRVSVVEPAGSDTFVSLVLGGQNCTARIRPNVSIQAGASFNFAVNMDRALVFDPASEKRLPM